MHYSTVHLIAKNLYKLLSTLLLRFQVWNPQDLLNAFVLTEIGYPLTQQVVNPFRSCYLNFLNIQLTRDLIIYSVI